LRTDFLEDFVVPVCLAEEISGQAYLRHLMGTAFFVDLDGTFLTAAHILESIDARTGAGTLCGLNVKSDEDRPANIFSEIQEWEKAPSPFDIAIGKIRRNSRKWFEIADHEIAAWKDVATMGYPEVSLNTIDDKFNVHMRMLKGYVQRIVKSGELQILGTHPDCFELSFAISSGMSGSPLFTVDNDRPQLIGVCVGSFSAEVVDYDTSEVDAEGAKFSEKRLRVEQIGIAESIFPLLSWRPVLCGGKSLGELVS
jgi:hypothetical protein